MNLGCFDALIWMVSPVLGLRPVVAARWATEKVPKPTIRTSPPDFNADVMLSNTPSTARPASAFGQPAASATAETRSFLFIGTPVRFHL